jgi:hypothetical protein
MVDYLGTFRGPCNALYHLENSLTDSSGNSNTLSNIVGTPTLQIGQKFGYNALFSGGNALGASSSATWNIASNNPFSIGYWIYSTDLNPSSNGGGHPAGNTIRSGADIYGFTTRVQSDGALVLRICRGNSGEGDAITTSTGVVSVNTLYHVVMTFNGTNTGAIYVNGAAKSTTGTLGAIVATSSCHPTVGCRYLDDSAGKDRYFKGYIDDVFLTGYVLAASDIRKLYNYAVGKYGV